MNEICFKINNELIEREIYLEDGLPRKSVIRNRCTGVEWTTDSGDSLISFEGINLHGCEVSLEDRAIVLTGKTFEVCWEFTIYDDIPIIESRIGLRGKIGKIEKTDGLDFADGIGCASEHITVRSVRFFDQTDHTNCLVEEREHSLLNTGKYSCNGHVFIVRDDLTQDVCVIVKNAPCEDAHYNKKYADFYANKMDIRICSNGIDTQYLEPEEYIYTYPVAIGVCSDKEWKQQFRQYYKQSYSIKPTYIMSNTWGDRNCDKCVCEEFILKEIDKAKELGADIVQIDDGWQQGKSINYIMPGGGGWIGGYRQADPNHWVLDYQKFPRGLEPIVQAANERNIALGLWFAPDNKNDYESWSLDADLMLDFYHRYGIRYFKIDGVIINNSIGEKNLLRMFDKVTKLSGGKIVFNMDITAGKRFGYLMHREIGDIFVENRYTDWKNYYPHNTLRNLWDLANYFPTQRFQMEVLNNMRNIQLYSNMLAPAEYDIDYLFASVMVANPLLWMEMSQLDEESSKRLAAIISVYKKYRKDFLEVYPILQRPNGFSMTGFRIKGKDQDYVLIFRELCENKEVPVKLNKILASNDQVTDGVLREFTKKRSYIFAVCDKENAF